MMQAPGKDAASEAVDREINPINEDVFPNQEAAVLDDSDMHRMGKAQELKVCLISTSNEAFIAKSWLTLY